MIATHQESGVIRVLCRKCGTYQAPRKMYQIGAHYWCRQCRDTFCAVCGYPLDSRLDPLTENEPVIRGETVFMHLRCSFGDL